MKKINLLMFLMLVMLSSTVYAQVTYTGYMTPTPIVTNASMEIVSNDGTDYYVTFSEDTSKAGLYNVATGTVTTAYTTFSSYANTYHWSFQDSTNYIVFFKPATVYYGTYSLVLLGSTSSGSFSGKTVYNASVLGNKYNSSIMINANQTHFKSTDTNIYAFDTPLIGKIKDIDNLNDNIVVIDEDRNVYEYTTTGTLINKGEIKTSDVPEDITGMYIYNELLYITTRTTIYSFTFSKYYILNGENYDIIQCIDNYSISNNTIFIEQNNEIQLYSNIDDVSRCDGLCNSVTKLDEDNVTYKTGECVFTGCFNECDFEAYKTCQTSKTYKVCGNFDTDECLEYSYNNYCLANQRCVTTGDLNYGECEDINYSSYDTLYYYPDYFFKLVSVSDDNYEITNIDVNKYKVQTSNDVASINFKLLAFDPLTSFYSAKICDFKPVEILGKTISGFSSGEVYNYDNRNYLKLNETAYKVFTGTNKNPINSINILLKEDYSAFKVGYGNEINIMNYIYVENNKTTKNLKVSIANSTNNNVKQLFSDTGINNVEDINIQVTYNYDLFQYDIYIEVYRAGEKTYYQTAPINFNDVNTYMSKIILENITNKIYISDLEVISNYDTPNFKTQKLSDKIICTYNEEKCYTTRLYGNANNIEMYNSYTDFEICINNLGVTKVSNELDEVMSLPFWVKLLMMIITFLIIYAIFFLVGESNKTQQYIGVTLEVIATVLFVSIGFIPVWVILLIFIIIGMIASGIFRKAFFGE